MTGSSSSARLQLLLELALQVFLGPGGEDPRPPELVDDEEQDQEPEGHERPADARDRTCARRDRTGCVAAVRPRWSARFAAVTGPSVSFRSVPHPRSPELWLRCVRLRSAVCMLGRFPALAGADLEVETGEVLLLSGPNGAGKTTLLRLCAGLLPLRAGEAEVLGVDLTVEPPPRAPGGRARRARDLLLRRPHRRRERALRGAVDRSHGVADADAALERVGLQRVANVAHGRLSQGQRRRLVARERARRARPRLLLLDEPHAGLDEHGREVLEDIVRSGGRATAAR